MADSELEPDRARRLRHEVGLVRFEVFGATKDVHQVDRARNIRKLTVDGLPKDLGDFRVVRRHGYDRETCILHVFRNVECGLPCVLLGLDAEHGDPFGARE